MTRSAIIAGPRGWSPATISKRFASAPGPSSYDAESHTCDAVLSMGTRVKRFYGTEVLRIDPQSVIIERMVGAGIPLLDSHNQSGISSALGRVTRVWFSGGALMGKLSFNATKEGRIAEGMVARGELSGISAGYRVEEWSISDADGNVIDGDRAQWDDDLTFTATRWELLECSLVCVPADSTASVRSLGIGGGDVDDVHARMLSRQRMATRQRMVDAQGRVIGRK